MKISVLRQRVRELLARLENGCGNEFCLIRPTPPKRGAMSTGGFCRCTPREIVRQVDNLTADLGGFRWTLEDEHGEPKL